MSFLPFESFGSICGKIPPVIFKKKKKFFFICSIHSSITLFRLKNFFIKAKSPFLHPHGCVSSIGCFKNRNIINLKNAIYVLDYFTPTTRFFLKKEKITAIFCTPNFFLITHKTKLNLWIFNPWKLSLVVQLHFDNEIKEVKNLRIKENKEILFILTKNNNISGWNLSKIQRVYDFRFDFFTHVSSFFIINKSNKMALILKNKKILIFDFFRKKYLFVFDSELLKKIKNLHHIVLFKEWIIFLGKKNNCSYNRFYKNFIKWNFYIHNGKLNSGNFVKNSKIFLTSGLFDNTISLYEISKKYGKFFLLNYKKGISLPIEKIKKFSGNLNHIIMTNRKGFLSFSIQKKVKKLNLGTIKKHNKHFVSHLLIKNNFEKKKIAWIILCFYKKKNPFIWDMTKKIFYQISSCTNFSLIRLKNILSIKIFPKKKNLLVGYEKNCICLFILSKKKIDKYVFSHHFSIEKKSKCFIRAIEISSNGKFFISGCSHGNLKLWKERKMVVLKNLKFKNRILKSKWCFNSDTIIIICDDNKIYFVIPEDFSIKKILIGHSDLVTEIYLLKNSKMLISTSIDKTLKIWNINTSKCIDTTFLDFPVVNFEIDCTETFLITIHDFTIGIGIWKRIPNYILEKIFFFQNSKNKRLSDEENGFCRKKNWSKNWSKLNFKTSRDNFFKKKFSFRSRKILNWYFEKKKNNTKIPSFEKKKNQKNFLETIVSGKKSIDKIFQNYHKINLPRIFFLNRNFKINFLFLVFLEENFIEALVTSRNLEIMLNFLNLLIKKFQKEFDNLNVGNLHNRIVLEILRLGKRLGNWN
ncbi:hypothetical protein CMESO_524 (nucleomorph) [Chroomonas mesostigmatica CCMP1168]|uniref:Uncharacterized protein n=1 Tax=Chroomonas mesostigmatica CCMP1168 TaxID=1195612 RepID=J7G8U2_9CRYP|nr:hypothetical protein CMESO_524 [Chroomonas mesostigmatica CCMP1168]